MFHSVTQVFKYTKMSSRIIIDFVIKHCLRALRSSLWHYSLFSSETLTPICKLMLVLLQSYQNLPVEGFQTTNRNHFPSSNSSSMACWWNHQGVILWSCLMEITTNSIHFLMSLFFSRSDTSKQMYLVSCLGCLDTYSYSLN